MTLIISARWVLRRCLIPCIVLRDSFKDTLCYIVGMRQEATYLPELDLLGELYELVDTQVCWLGPMGEADSRHAIASLTYTASRPPQEPEIDAILALTRRLSRFTQGRLPLVAGHAGQIVTRPVDHYPAGRSGHSLPAGGNFGMA